MHILHICNDFLGTTAHESLYSELDKLGIIQTVFVPTKKYVKRPLKKITFQTIGSDIVYSVGLSRYHKVLYGLKIKKLVKDIEKKVELASIDIIHTPILSNEGAVAYELYKVYKIPYITAVRNSDINDYFRIFKWRKPYFRRIVQEAINIIFISSRYPERLKKELHLDDRNVESKYRIIHNGISDVFLTNKSNHTRYLKEPVKIVMTGAFGRNKNIDGLFKAVQLMRNSGFEIELSAIGNNLSTNPQEKQYAEYIRKLSKENTWFKIYDAQPREELLFSLRNYDIFALVSHHETFGLSYVEALSQGLPIVYTKGEGFDGTYKEGFVGFGACSNSPESISAAITKVINEYQSLIANISDLDLSEYSWTGIASKYFVLYKDILNTY